ncbi:MAG: hypothetical protein WKF84_04015 [Pyrinomonadaceae bacterium]
MLETRHQDLRQLRECSPPPVVVSFFDRDQLIEQYLPYSRALAVDVMCELNSPAQIELNDLVGYGELGLAEAAERFDLEPRRSLYNVRVLPHPRRYLRWAAARGLGLARRVQARAFRCRRK